MMAVVLAQAGSAPSPSDPRVMFFNFLPLILVFLIFYFLILRPQSKRQRELAKMIGDLKRGDRVVTSGGALGDVVDVKDDTAILKVADNVKMEFTKQSIVSVVKKSE
jgi:preprotein translocase subunit YajC